MKNDPYATKLTSLNSQNRGHGSGLETDGKKTGGRGIFVTIFCVFCISAISTIKDKDLKQHHSLHFFTSKYHINPL
jgi:hypothetical protein